VKSRKQLRGPRTMTTSKSILSLSTDIYQLLDSSVDHKPDADIAAAYAMRIGGEFAKATLLRDKPRKKGRLWASDIGKKCLRQSWYKFNKPMCEAPLTGNTKFKFLYGNILEEAVLYFAEEAGHEVRDQQERVETTVKDWEVTGKIDAVIDGVLVDVKSTSSYGYVRYADGIDFNNDTFGYLQQLGFYQAFGSFQRTASQQGFVWIDKQNGHIRYNSCPVEGKSSLTERITNIIDAVEEPAESLVPRGFAPKPYGKSGNMSLPTGCSYCSFKRECFRKANGGKGLRTFLYSNRPVDFTEVVKEPKVPELANVN